MRKYSQLPLIVLAFLVGSFISTVTTIVIANGGDPNLIHSCVNNTTGAVRIVALNTTCNSGETALNWNSKGLPGTGALVSNLNGASINNTDFSYRTLKNDDFSGIGCSLNSNTFNHTDMRNVNLTGCSLDNSRFSNTDFTVITMGNNSLEGVNIADNSDLSNKDLTSDTFKVIAIDSTNLTGVNMSNHVFADGTTFITNSNLTNANLSGVTFSVGSGAGIDFTNSNLSGTNFMGADFSTANTAIFSGITGSNTNFTNANLTSAITTGASLTSPIWSNTTCPDGTNSNSNGNTCVGHGF